jgi:lactate permease
MISPQSIAVAAAAGHLVGKESELFRFTVKHSFIMLLFICFIVLAQAYVFKWLIPEYHSLVANATTATNNFSKAYTYLGILMVVIGVLASIILVSTKKKIISTEAIKPGLLK